MDGTGPGDTGTEYPSGHLIVTGDRISAIGSGPVPAPDLNLDLDLDRAVTIDGRGCLATPGLVNTHHHLYQWLTQGRAQQQGLFGWLTELYPVWTRIDPGAVAAAATAGLAWLALSGCSTSTDHHYMFPRRLTGSAAAEVLAAEIAAARRVGLRFHPCRGSMDLGESRGGLPPDDAVEDTGAALAATEAAIAAHHDPSPGAMLRIAVGPCSPFTATPELMRESAALARATGTRLHTHLAETADEDDYCRERTGRSPAEFIEDLGWLGPDVWLAHCVHLDDAAIGRLAATGTGVAHCPSSNARLGAGIAPVRCLLAAGVPVGLGVDGPASSEGARLAGEIRQALLSARSRGTDGAAALTARQALWLATRGGARCLGRDDEIGALRPGALADVALWRLDTLAHDAIAQGPGGDPV
ncbi:MAG TPA: 8-oxoguanine deaminase, partial [Streptosporangiaceae bacterium]|nr:8-oxoguanine deaminase [Streptosporangiaceae bacterium]